MARHLTRRSFLSLAAASLAATRLPAFENAAPLLYIGSTTRKPGDGIHVARWDRQSGTLGEVKLAFEAVSPSFLAVTHHRKQPLLFAGYQTSAGKGAMGGFRIDPSGSLQPLNALPADKADFVHLALDHSEQCLVTANYGKGDILSCRIGPEGMLSDFVSHIQLTGHGPNSPRQDVPHAHGVAIAPNNRFVYINDLGTDRIFIYKLNPATAELTANDPPFFQGAAGSGPRHLMFHPKQHWAYSINEMNSTITFMLWNAKSGALTSIENVPTMATDGDIAVNRAGELAFDKDGQFLYACNRGGMAEQLMTYSVGIDGRLTLAGRVQTAGKEARHFIVSPDGGYLIVAEQFSNEVVMFARDRKSGLLTPTVQRYPIDGASCVVMA